MTKQEVYDKDGALVRTLHPGETYSLKDGESLRVRVQLMDDANPLPWLLQQQDEVARKQNLLHRPGYAVVSDAQIADRESRIAAHKQALSTAWRHAPTLDPAQSTATRAPVNDGAIGDAYSRYERRLLDAWKVA